MANPAAEHAVDAVNAVDHSEHTTATVEHPAGGEGAHEGPEVLGLGPSAVAGLAMLVFILLLIWKKVPSVITGGLDAKIAEIKHQLDEAKQLRAEAETLRNEYSAKIANAEKDAAAMIEHARHEAEGLIAKAASDSDAMIVRRQKMAEDKIAAAERAAVAEVKARAVTAAAAASKVLIAKAHDGAADKKLADEVIASL